MINPQSYALRITKVKNIKAIADYGCCAFATLWALGVDVDDELDAIEILDRALENGALKKNCLVSWVDFARFVSGREIDIEFLEIKSLLELNKKKAINNRFVVRYDYKGNSHWVGIENGKIAFNSLASSSCVEFGTPTQARIITLSK